MFPAKLMGKIGSQIVQRIVYSAVLQQNAYSLGVILKVYTYMLQIININLKCTLTLGI